MKVQNKMKMVMVSVLLMSVASVQASAGEPAQVVSSQPGISCEGGLPTTWSSWFSGVRGDVGGSDAYCGVHSQYMLDAQGQPLVPNGIRVYFSRYNNKNSIEAWCIAERTLAHDPGSWYAFTMGGDSNSISSTNNTEALDMYVGNYEPAAQLAEHAVGVLCQIGEDTILFQVQQIIREWKF